MPPVGTRVAEWCGNALFALSPEKRRLLSKINDFIASIDYGPRDLELHRECLKRHSFDRYMLRMIAAHLHLRAPYATAELLKNASLPNDPRRLTALDEIHFTISREIDEIAGEDFLAVGSYLSPEAMTIHRNRRLIRHHLLHNTEDWDFVLPLLRDRHMWDYNEVMALLPTLKSSSAASLSDGML